LARQWLVRPDPVVPDLLELEREAKGLRQAIDLLEVGFAKVAEAIVSHPAYDGDPFGAGAWFRKECHMATSDAIRSATIGAELDGLPASLASLCAGRIGIRHLGLIATTSQAVRTASPEHQLPEAALLERAESKTVYGFSQECAHLRHAADSERFRRLQAEDAEYRTLKMHRTSDGSLALDGWLDPAGAATLWSALDPLARPNGAGDSRLIDQRRADALVELAHLSLDGGQLPTSGGVKPHLTVTADVRTLMGLKGSPGGELEAAGVVGHHTVQRIACDATIRRVVFDAKGAVIDAGRARRVASPAQLAALRARDHGCIWPGCDRQARFTAAHHIKHWGEWGVWGETNLSNLVLLCHRHHWMVHEGGWSLSRSDDEQWVAVPPALRRWSEIRGSPGSAA